MIMCWVLLFLALCILPSSQRVNRKGQLFGQECENRKEEVYWKSVLADYTVSPPIEDVH